MKKYQLELDMTKAKISTEQEKLDKATEKNRGLRQILNLVMSTELNEEGDAKKPTRLSQLLNYNKQRRRQTVQVK